MRILPYVLAVSALSASSGAQADLNAKELVSKIEAGTGAYQLVWLQGNVDALLWANIELRREGLPLLFCQPPKLALTPEQDAQILGDYVREHPVYADAPPGLAMLKGLENTFPCQPKRP